MKLAVLGDIHGNLVALQRVAAHLEQWQPDVVVVAGDVVNRGPRPLECLQFVQKKEQTAKWRVVRGNHEDYVIGFAQPNNRCNGPAFEVFRSTYWTYCQLKQDVSALEAMPFQISLTAPDGTEIWVVHASVHHNRDGVFPLTTDAQLRQKIRLPQHAPPALFCTAHTHCPLVRSIDQTLVVNAGAVGLPFDGDRRTGYAQLTWHKGQWQAEIIRLDYDRRQAERDFFETGFMAGGGPLTQLILDEFYIARPHLYQWTQQYETLALAGKITVEEAVTTYLAERRT